MQSPSQLIRANELQGPSDLYAMLLVLKTVLATAARWATTASPRHRPSAPAFLGVSWWRLAKCWA